MKPHVIYLQEQEKALERFDTCFLDFSSIFLNLVTNGRRWWFHELAILAPIRERSEIHLHFICSMIKSRD